MCIDFPGRIVERQGEVALVQHDGRCHRANTMLVPDVAVGDWVFVAAGTIVERLDPDEAAQIREQVARAVGVER